MGFTDAVLTIIRNSPDELTARNIRDRMVQLGYELGKYSNPLGFIHSVLGRLEQQGKIRQSAPGCYVFSDALYQAILALSFATPDHSNDVIPRGASTPEAEDFVRALGFGSTSSTANTIPTGLTPPPKADEKVHKK